MAAIVTSGDGSRRSNLTPADTVTLGRSLLVVACGGLVLAGRGHGRSWVVPVLAATAWSLDGVDGYVARRTGTVTERGARWDNAADASLVGVLALAVVRDAPCAPVGAALYPAYRLVRRLRPGWRRPIPSSRRGKVVGGTLTGTLLAGTVPGVPRGAVTVATGAAVGAALWSFAVDLTWLEVAARAERAVRPEEAPAHDGAAAHAPSGQPTAEGKASR